ncbi:MAG TPA: Ni/Fe hydrogenase subunit beta [Persephonella sp.]|nr:Ni/Fe hydrogenase subunit beta [Persephonella sp.]
MVKIKKTQLQDIFDLLKKEYRIVGPVLKDGVIQLDYIESFNDLPSGYTQVEEKSFYKTEKNGEGFFSYSRPSLPYKRFLMPPEFTFFSVKKENGELKFEEKVFNEKIAFFDIRACDLKAIQILDDVFINKNKHPDPYYKAVRENIFIVAVTCFSPSDVCFCSSMGIKLKPDRGFDILLTELDDCFIVEWGTEKGRRLLENLHYEKILEKDLQKINKKLKEIQKKIKRYVDTQNLPQILYSKIEGKHWEDIGRRCLACTSCTQLCPTCFCFDIVEKNFPLEKRSDRVRVYDSCFSPTFATVHRFNIRESIASRYRQWLMHKFAYWTDQFGEFGCVGCGRCITWCPAMIDITQEIKNIRESR